MELGTIKWFSREKGFGVITPLAGGDDVFLHASAIADGGDTLAEGKNVSFEREVTAEAVRARAVRAIG